MNDIKKFFEIYFDKAVNLKKEFRKTEPKSWDETTVLLELMVQIGHVVNIFRSSSYINEPRRKINNLGDELSDVLLQLSYLVFLESIELKEINRDKYKHNKITTFGDMIVLMGQLTEAIMEKEQYRFYKKRFNFETNDKFIEDRIIKMINIIFDYCDDENIDILKEFDMMQKDATVFLEGFYV